MALTKEQLLQRRDKIGGSDAAAICGKDPHRTAYEVALRIRGEIEPQELDGLDHIEFGNEMEGVLARFYERKNATALWTPPQLAHREHPWMVVNIDRLRKDRPEVGIECKNTGLFVNEAWGEPGTDEVPARVLLQCQHAMMIVPELQTFHVLRCHGGNRYQQFGVPRNAELIESLYEIEVRFYEGLQKGVLPEPDWAHRSTDETLRRAFRRIEGQIEDMPELAHWTKAFEEAAAERLRYEKLEEQIKNHVAFIMRNAEIGVLPDGRRWRRRLVKRKGYEVQAKEYIECRLID
jgi:putative phage-type endonuclease